MSAHSDFLDFLYGGPSPTGTREGDADYWFHKFAHELAEKIRKVSAERYQKGEISLEDSEVMDDVADLIDPEKS